MSLPLTLFRVDHGKRKIFGEFSGIRGTIFLFGDFSRFSGKSPKIRGQWKHCLEHNREMFKGSFETKLLYLRAFCN